MSNSPKTLDEVAERACSEELPHGRLTTTSESLIESYVQRQGIVKGDIAQAMRSFSAMTSLLMPGEAVDAYVREECVQKSMPFIFHQGIPVTLVSGWADEEGPYNTWTAPGVLDRKASPEKYTHAEVLACINMAMERPEIPLSLLLFQRYLEQYFTELRSRIAVTSPERAASLERFQIHWSDATNFLRATLMGLSLAMGEKHDERTIEHIDQELVTRAFQSLEDMGAFDFVIPDLPTMRIESMTFSCPARPQLKEMFVTNGTYMAVVEKVKRMTRGDFVDGLEAVAFMKSRLIVRQVAETIGISVSAKDKETFRIINQLGQSRI